MWNGHLAHFRSKAQCHRDERLRRLLEKLAVAFAVAAAMYAGLFILAHINGTGAALISPQYNLAEVYYPNCAAARAAGAAPIYRGQPGYRAGLDADNDGIACEPYRNWGANN